jgi:hypothetical protein
MGGTPYNENAVTEASEEPTSRTKDGRHPRGRQRRAIGALTRIHPPFAFYEQPAGHGQ